MDDTLDIDIMDIPILDSYWCEICHQDISVDDRSPNGLISCDISAFGTCLRESQTILE